MKDTGGGQIGDIMLRGAMGGMQQAEEYVEKPRPSLYNVIKKLKEQKGAITNRLVYMAKVNEQVFKGDLEKDQSSWVNTVTSTIENNPEEEPGEITGFAVILGPWVVHLIEAETPLMMQFLKKLLEKRNAKVSERGSYYHNAWVVQYTEDIPQRAYFNWNCKQVQTSQATREVKTLGDFEKSYTIYESMVNIGVQAQAVQNKGTAQVVSQMKQAACEYIPCGEELASVVTDEMFTLQEFCEYIFDTPDICLEREVQWPDQEELTY